ncbi:hypothetical protein PHYSODRAFT_293013 [Phytophthora sojae]|uniref:Uncharacterized protein n=1 Tax=Phytophthora sojae (strain P6497) TaxID=1094619 RepID=G4YED4_PHYSP|nr:hypothetical protein PHYSODRAFT_293013 [Phytophthora sojae]EGZ26841.1 hypothetical protein PHYSODRAFT_293013 [Phytophthora sojae]|eukprot:XP_009514116.1 hypothetical protein PHYSODRAFT_293013 [Phytophthora sojae]
MLAETILLRRTAEAPFTVAVVISEQVLAAIMEIGAATARVNRCGLGIAGLLCCADLAAHALTLVYARKSPSTDAFAFLLEAKASLLDSSNGAVELDCTRATPCYMCIR